MHERTLKKGGFLPLHITGTAKLWLFGIPAAALTVVSIFSEYLCPYDPYAQDLSHAMSAPDADHLLGTDVFGRDMLSRVIAGSRISILSTLGLVLAITLIGTAVGVLCGWYGHWIDTLLMRICDVFFAFPGLVFALAIAGILGGGLHNAMIALAAISWPKYARIARSRTLVVKESLFIKASVMSGCTTSQLIIRHILPNITGVILVTAVLDIGTVLMELAGLSFLGLGVRPPIAEWGSMMSNSRSLLVTAPWITLSPGMAIFVSVMIFNLFGDTIRDYLDPKLRQA